MERITHYKQLQGATVESDKENFSDEVHALAIHLNDDTATLDEVERWLDNEDYLVLDDEDADKKAEEYIRESVWAFNADFLSWYCPDGIEAEHITTLRGDSCEGCNDAMVALVEAGQGMKKFISEAISTDGRGHFMSSYDGEENEVTYNDTEYYIYRIN
jgi:hypothetical protein